MLVLIKPDNVPVRVPNQHAALMIVTRENCTFQEDGNIIYPTVREESGDNRGPFLCNYYVKDEVYVLWQL